VRRGLGGVAFGGGSGTHPGFEFGAGGVLDVDVAVGGGHGRPVAFAFPDDLGDRDVEADNALGRVPTARCPSARAPRASGLVVVLPHPSRGGGCEVYRWPSGVVTWTTRVAWSLTTRVRQPGASLVWLQRAHLPAPWA
jgi:hypothetical protein